MATFIFSVVQIFFFSNQFLFLILHHLCSCMLLPNSRLLRIYLCLKNAYLTLVKSLPTGFSPNFRRYVVQCDMYSEDAKLFVSCWLHYILDRKQDFELFTWHLSITLISCWKKAKYWFLKFLLEISMVFFRIKASKLRKITAIPSILTISHSGSFFDLMISWF